jgi:hypothetical protein
LYCDGRCLLLGLIDSELVLVPIFITTTVYVAERSRRRCSRFEKFPESISADAKHTYDAP